MKTILAAPNLLKIEKISFCSDEVRLVVKTKLLKATCPSCGRQSDKAHSRYQRHLADLPWEGVAVKLVLLARKFFCLTPDCLSLAKTRSPLVSTTWEMGCNVVEPGYKRSRRRIMELDDVLARDRLRWPPRKVFFDGSGLAVSTSR